MKDNKKIFLSYNSKDGDDVAKIFALLEKQGLNPWMDKAGLQAGSRWSSELEKQIESCDVFSKFYR